MAVITSEKELKKLTAIVRIHDNIGASLDPTEISRIIVRELSNITHCDACAILLVNEYNVKILAETGFARTFGNTEFSIDTPMIRHIINTKQGTFSGDVSLSLAVDYIPPGSNISSMICAPVIVHNEVKGIISLNSFRKNAFRKEDLEFVEVLSREVSIAIERSILFAQIQDIAVRDGLTACFNRRKFDVDIVAEIAGSNTSGKPLSLLMLDIDWFKKYNDFHGHAKGDLVLKQIVAVFISSTRPLDKTYRYGGEEFACLLPDTNKQKALLAAARLQKTVEKTPFEGAELSQPEKRLTISIGVASFPADAETAADLVEKADSALYQAKKTGRNRVCSFTIPPPSNTAVRSST